MVHALPGLADAVKRPVAVMIPHDAVQVTGALVLNCCVSPAGVAAPVGVIASGVATVTVVDAKLPLADLAVTVQGPGVRRAVYKPPVLIVPHEAVYVGLPLVLNCTVAPSCTVGFRGEIANPVDPATLSLPYTVNFGETVAVPTMVQDVPTVAVAVKRPLAVIVPHFAVQATGAEVVNCCVCPSTVVADTGVITIGETIVRLAVAVPLPSAAVAFIVQVVLGYSGALKSPAELIVPQVVVQVDGTLAMN
jgi:hypothetical protein